LFTFISSARIIEVADAGITDKLKAVIAARNVPAPGSGTDPSFTYDVWVDFESNTDCTDAQIDATDHTAVGSWSNTVGNLGCVSTAAKVHGDKGAAGAAAAGGVGRLKYILPASIGAASLGFWFKSGSGYAGWGVANQIILVVILEDESLFYLGEGTNSGTNARELYGTGADAITISDSTWYWITVGCTQNDVCEWALYNTSDAQVGATQENAIGNYYIDSIQIGSESGISATDLYYDDLVMDFTDATFPLGPYSQ